MPVVYMDANATTPIDESVLDAMLPYLREHYGNASSIHSIGRAAAAGVDSARFAVARFLGVDSSAIIFTSSGTEANQLAIRGLVDQVRRGAASEAAGLHCITSAVEHSSVLEAFRALEAEGVSVDYLPADTSGVVPVERIEAAFRRAEADGRRSVLLSLMLANNETGVIQPVAQAARVAAGRGVAVHTDAVQAAGKLAFTLPEIGADLLTVSAHKMRGPKGCGVLAMRRGIKLQPLVRGTQERGLRGGTGNVAAIVGAGAACGRAASGTADRARAAARLRDRFESAVTAGLGGLVRINGGESPRLCNTSSLAFPGVGGEALLARLDVAGLCASRGAACSSGASRPSHVIRAMGLSAEIAASTIRFSLGETTTEEEVDAAIAIVLDTVRRMQRSAS